MTGRTEARSAKARTALDRSRDARVRSDGAGVTAPPADPVHDLDPAPRS